MYSRARCFFFNDTATTEIYTLSLHDALPICCDVVAVEGPCMYKINVHYEGNSAHAGIEPEKGRSAIVAMSNAISKMKIDRKSTRLNSSNANISYAVFCLKKKKTHVPLIALIH